MQSVVIDVAEDGAGTDAVGAILGIDELAETVHDHSTVLPLALLLVLLRLQDRERDTTQRVTPTKTQTSSRHCVCILTNNTLMLLHILLLLTLALSYWRCVRVCEEKKLSSISCTLSCVFLTLDSPWRPRLRRWAL